MPLNVLVEYSVWRLQSIHQEPLDESNRETISTIRQILSVKTKTKKKVPLTDPEDTPASGLANEAQKVFVERK